MRFLVLNCGSSSIKSAVVDAARRQRLLDIRIENLGSADCMMCIDGSERTLGAGVGLEQAMGALITEVRARQGNLGPIRAVAHRIVHGGERFVRPAVLDPEVLRQIEALSRLAPLHNPPAIAAIRVARPAFADVPHIAIFDTAFHATLPRRAREYALPDDVRTRLGIRRFGFHGINHAHVMHAVAEYMHAAPHDLRIVSCHLGNGASLAAIEYGRSVETSMGMTPLEGLVMGTRAGDLDPGIILELLGSGGMDRRQLDELLNRRSGLLGLAGTNDMREVERRAAEGDEGCRLAIELYSHRIRKYIGAYAAIMGGVEVIAFTAGVGENSALVRHRSLQRLEFLGATLDEHRNGDARVDPDRACVEISEERSRTRLLVVRADEELQMAREAAAALRTAETGEAGVKAGYFAE